MFGPLVTWLSGFLPGLVGSITQAIKDLWDVVEKWGLKFWAAVLAGVAVVKWCVQYVRGIAANLGGYIDMLVMPDVTTQFPVSFGHWAMVANTFFPLDEFFALCIITLAIMSALLIWNIVKRILF